MIVIDYNLWNKIRTSLYRSKYINGEEEKALSYSRLVTNKYQRNVGVRKSLMDAEVNSSKILYLKTG